MALTDLQKATAQAIVNIFETSRVRGDYAKVTFHPDDPGHLTYGRSQTTLASGNLFLLLKAYAQAPGAAFATGVEPFLPRLEARDFSLDHDAALRELLRDAGGDPVMQSVQDAFFDRVYWAPAAASAGSLGVASPLGVTVVYDSRVHGSWPRMRDRTTERHGASSALGEKDWVSRYVEVRHEWLAGHSNTLLQRTVYRMEAFRVLIGANKWKLPLPLRVRGVEIRKELLEQPAEVRVSAEDETPRLLRLRTPFLVGDDVEQLQRVLVQKGFPLEADGIFGPATDAAVRRFQQRAGLVDDGIAGAATRAALGLSG